MTDKIRCWGSDDALMMAYHDDEWGFPTHDDTTLFEFLLLDNFQAGLSWRTILHRREGFRNAYDNFDAAKIAAYGDKDVARLLADAGIIRNRSKVACSISNAQAFLETQAEFGSFDAYLWQFTGGKTIDNVGLKTWDQTAVTTAESDAMSKGLKSRGFKFVGSTICYAYMQSIGMVNDHLESCFRRNSSV